MRTSMALPTRSGREVASGKNLKGWAFPLNSRCSERALFKGSLAWKGEGTVYFHFIIIRDRKSSDLCSEKSVTQGKTCTLFSLTPCLSIYLSGRTFQHRALIAR